jgi:hypothetical protein
MADLHTSVSPLFRGEITGLKFLYMNLAQHSATKLTTPQSPSQGGKKGDVKNLQKKKCLQRNTIKTKQGMNYDSTP